MNSRTLLTPFVAVVALVALATTAATAEAAAVSKRAVGTAEQQWVAGELLVRFASDVERREAGNVHARHGARVLKRIGGLRVDRVKLPRGVSVREALAEYRADPRVEAAEPNYYRYALETIPNDTNFANLWGLQNTQQLHPLSDSASTASGKLDADIDATEAWDLEQGKAGTIIAVLDTGVDVSHPDLAGSLWTNPGESGDGKETNGLDDDANGKIDDVNGWDFAAGDGGLLAPPSIPGYDHGTHVAGTTAAAMNNAAGVAGVCPGCRIMPLKVMADDGTFPLSAELDALAYAKAKGAHIVNVSLGGPVWSGLEREAFRTGGFLAVVSAGNESLDNDMYLARDLDGDGYGDMFSPSYPASYNVANVVSVSASNHRDENAYATGCYLFDGLTKRECAFTSWGHDSVDLAAPGVDVESTLPGGAYGTYSGTSMAAPHVAGVAGLVKSRNPLLTVAEVKNAVMRGVDTPSTLNVLHTAISATSRTGYFTRTSGRANAQLALTAATTNATPRTDGNIDGARAFTWSATNAVRWPDDVNDVFKRKLYRGVTYRLTLDGPYGKDFDLLVWKPRTQEIWQITAACTYPATWQCRLVRWAGSTSADESIRFRAASTGYYYFQVNAYLFNSGSYTLRLRRL